jgi:DNA repair exonuclease SbcCD ATPase subunit
MIVSAKNFLSWENLEFKVPPGVTLIQGFNFDDQTPEGSGKSAVLNALCWGFFGCIPKDANVDEVIREGASSCEVKIVLPELTVFRSRKPNDLHLIKAGKIIRGKDARETQKMIERELGLTFESFCQSIYFAQNYLNKFVTANQEKKGQILSEIEDLEQFDRARDIAGKKAKAVKEKLASTIKDVERNVALRAGAEASVANFEELIEQFQSEKAVKIQQLLKQLQVLEAEAEEYVAAFETQKTRDIEQAKKRVRDAEANLTQNASELAEIMEVLKSNEHQALAQKISDAERELKLLNDKLTDVKIKMGSIKTMLEAQEKRERELKKAERELITVVANLSELVNETKDREADVAEYLKLFLTAEAALNNPEKDDCPTCGQAWDGDKSHYEKEFEKAAKAYKRAQDVLASHIRGIKQFDAQAEELKPNIESLKEEIAAFEVPSTEKLDKQKRQVSTNIANTEQALAELKTQMRSYEKLELRIESLTERTVLLTETLDSAITEHISCQAQSPVKELERMQKRMTELENQAYAEDKKEPTLLEQKLKDAKKQLKTIIDNHKTTLGIKADEEQLLIRLEALREGYRETKAYAFQSVLNQLTRKANGYLTELFEQPVKIKFENQDLKIETSITIDGKSRSLGLYSGGQFRRIALAVDLALADITMSRKSNKLNLLVMDEYCKDLSEVSMEKVLNLLQARKCSTILIEHNSLFKSIVNNTFEVELIDGVSRRVE